MLARSKARPLSNKPDVAHSPATAVATTVLAVLAAVAGLASSKASSQALTAKNDAILAQTRASAAQLTNESHLTREHIYEASIAAGSALDPATLAKLGAVARAEESAARPFADRAVRDGAAVAAANERAERYAQAHDGYENAATFLEIAIALVSISALASSLYLVGVGGACGLTGLGILLYTLVRG